MPSTTQGAGDTVVNTRDGSNSFSSMRDKMANKHNKQII